MNLLFSDMNSYAFIKNADGDYFTVDGGVLRWTKNRSVAYSFADRFEAERYIARHKMPESLRIEN